MRGRTYNLILAVFWLGFAVVILLRDVILPEAIREKLNPIQPWLVVLLAFALATWNLTRWLTAPDRVRVQKDWNPFFKPKSGE